MIKAAHLLAQYSTHTHCLDNFNDIRETKIGLLKPA